MRWVPVVTVCLGSAALAYTAGLVVMGLGASHEAAVQIAAAAGLGFGLVSVGFVLAIQER